LLRVSFKSRLLEAYADHFIETLARWVGNYLTKSTGVKVVFESAIVPKWNDGVISLKNVFVTRRPGQGKAKVSKGSAGTAAAAAAAAQRAKDGETLEHQSIEVEDDGNYTQFDLTIETVNVTLSFAKWFNGKGLLGDVEVKGMRGIVDRTHVHWGGEYVDPRSYKHAHHPGDFEIDCFKMEDVLVTIHQPGGFRPFEASMFACELPQLRKQYLFYDFLAANTMSGSFDNSLFTIHPRQSHGYTGAQLTADGSADGSTNAFKKHSRLRIDGLNIDHLNRGMEGPFSWIHQGNVDIVADVMLPTDDDESIGKAMSDLYDRLESTVQDTRNNSTLETLDKTSPANHDHRVVVFDLRIHLNDVRAAVPLFTRDLSYMNNALVRPIVAYMNSRRTFIPINCRLVKRAQDFDGSWTLYDSGLMDDLSAEVCFSIALIKAPYLNIANYLEQTYEAFARDVHDDQARIRRFKKVGLWSLQLAVQALFMGMAGNIA
jgi:mitochondrial distribution and morphology protein 31